MIPLPPAPAVEPSGMGVLIVGGFFVGICAGVIASFVLRLCGAPYESLVDIIKE